MATPTPNTRLAIPVTEQDHALGPPDAPVTLVEYGDFECPDCGRAFPLVKELEDRMGTRMRFVFRHFPQYTIHHHASVAAQAAEAAAAQGKFWPMHDMLYKNQQNLASFDLSRFALRLELEIYKFDADVSSERFARKVRADYDGGVLSGVKGTPTLFINEERYTGRVEIEPLFAALQAAAEK